VRVLVCTRGETNAASRVRVDQYLPFLADHDVRVVRWDPTTRADVLRLGAVLLRNARWADVVVLQKPRQPQALITSLVRVNPSLIVDIDDAVWTWGSVVSSRSLHAIRQCRLVIAGSRHLAQRIEELAGNVQIRVIPSSVSLSRYTERPHTSDSAVLVLGWIGTGGSLSDFGPGVRRVLNELPKGKFCVHVVSDQPLQGVDSRWSPWSAQGEVGLLQSFDLGLMPLNDDERSRGRCGFKAVQYMAVGVPVIASDVGASSEIVDGSVGRLVDSDDGWYRAINELADNPRLRASLGKAARERVEAKFSVEANAAVLRSALDEARS
jgi:glycosyltransferase involved in cell wall biosynthesis